MSRNGLVRQFTADIASATFVYLVLAWMPGVVLLLLINESGSTNIFDPSNLVVSPINVAMASAVFLTPLVIIGLLAFYMRIIRKLNDPPSNRIWRDHLASMSMNFWVFEFFVAILWTIRLASKGRLEVLDGNLGASLLSLMVEEGLFLALIILPISLKTYKLISKGIEGTGDAATIRMGWETYLQRTTTGLAVWSIALVVLLSAVTLAHPQTPTTLNKIVKLAPIFWLPLLLLVPLSIALALSVEQAGNNDKLPTISKRSANIVEGIPVYLTLFYFVFLIGPMCWAYLAGKASVSLSTDIIVWTTSLLLVCGLALFFATYLRVRASQAWSNKGNKT